MKDGYIDEKIAKLGFGIMRLPLVKSDDWSAINHETNEQLQRAGVEYFVFYLLYGLSGIVV